MAENSNIEWCDHTFNPWIGCTKVSPACDNCYAEAHDNRFGGGHWGPHAPRRRTSESNWKKPLTWNRKAGKDGTRPRVFCASLADVFDNKVPEDWRSDLWELIRATPNLDWLLLTKRPQNFQKMLPDDWGSGYRNVWLGTTVENQKEADRRIPHLLRVPCVIRFLSCEPLIQPIDLNRIHETFDGGLGQKWESCITGRAFDVWSDRDTEGWPKIHWVIVGGESGPHARPMNPNWVRSLRDQCQAANTAFFFKQWGEWAPLLPDHEGRGDWEIIDAGGIVDIPDDRWPDEDAGEAPILKIGKKKAGRTLDGKIWNQTPETRP